MSEIVTQSLGRSGGTSDRNKAGLVTVGGILAALGASTCCIIPLALFSLGVGGAWIGRLTALAPYQPIFIVITFGLLGYGYWLVYRQSKVKCADGDACAHPLPNRVVHFGLWFATALVTLAIAWPYLLPLVLK